MSGGISAVVFSWSSERAKSTSTTSSNGRGGVVSAGVSASLHRFGRLVAVLVTVGCFAWGDVALGLGFHARHRSLQCVGPFVTWSSVLCGGVGSAAMLFSSRGGPVIGVSLLLVPLGACIDALCGELVASLWGETASFEVGAEAS